ncbi:MAG: hypothetical protein L3V56_02810 [Candidatus Magnetoovum sp. WYHC-5]|nr:hypothetical protein [Candidatus Magnetoovum sp. WYHC-5]
MNISYDSLFKILTVSGINLQFIKQRVRGMVEDYKVNTGRPDHEVSREVSRALITKSVLKVGSISVVTSSSFAVPGLGSIIGMLFAGAVDFLLILKEQVELCYKIAAAYNVELDTKELQAVSLAILGFSFTTGVVTQVGEIAIKKTIDNMAKRYIVKGIEESSQEVAKAILPRLLGRASRYIPLISIPVSTSINVVSTLTVGKQAIEYFSNWKIERAEQP